MVPKQYPEFKNLVRLAVDDNRIMAYKKLLVRVESKVATCLTMPEGRC